MPVITGLAVGIAFVVLFSFFFGSGTIPIAQPIDAAMAKNKHDDWLSQIAYNLPEVKAFRENYGHVAATGHSLSGIEDMRLSDIAVMRICTLIRLCHVKVSLMIT